MKAQTSERHEPREKSGVTISESTPWDQQLFFKPESAKPESHSTGFWVSPNNLRASLSLLTAAAAGASAHGTHLSRVIWR